MKFLCKRGRLTSTKKSRPSETTRQIDCRSKQTVHTRQFHRQLSRDVQSVVREETRFPRLVRHHRASSSSKTRRAAETPFRIFPHDSHEGETRRTLTRSLRSKETTRRDIIKSCHGYTQDPVSRRGVALGRGLNIRTRARENNPCPRSSITQERLSITDQPDSEISAV